MHHQAAGAQQNAPLEGLGIIGPVAIAVRGPSRSGKTTMCEQILSGLAAAGVRAAWVKHTHHLVDVPGKSSDRIWARRPAATVLQAGDRRVVTLPPAPGRPQDALADLPHDLDVVLYETHTPLGYPTFLSSAVEPEPGEVTLGRWRLYDEETQAQSAVAAITSLVPADRKLDMALRAALRTHGGHGCAGLVLGTRLALAGAAALGIEVPDTRKRLIVVAETDRCAVDGIQAVTGCRPGKRTLRLLDYGKLAATFFDEYSGRAVRVAARGDLRARVNATGERRHAVQRQAYATWPEVELFTIHAAEYSPAQNDRPGPPRSRVICVGCKEEVSDGRHVETELGPRCRPCGAGAPGTKEQTA